MEILQRLQALDILYAVLWAAIVGWGLQAGTIRQIGMLIGVYGAALVSGSVYKQVASAAALVIGNQLLPQIEFFAYVAVFVVIFALIGLLIWRSYPSSRFRREFGSDNLLGAVIAAVWGILFLIALLTMLRFYAEVPWKGQEATQQGISHQIQLSQVAPVLEVVAAPLWQIMVPWFPAQVSPHL